jgi:O-succinylbenzoic acid--CoA ligase
MEYDPRVIAKALGIALPDRRPGEGVAVLSGLPPEDHWRRLLSLQIAGRTVVLPDPGWPNHWTDQLLAPIRDAEDLGHSRILVATSGSTALPKWCVHSVHTLAAAGKNFAMRFGEAGWIHSVVVLPQHHVGGLLPILRSAACGGRVIFSDYRALADLKENHFPLKAATLSLVPTQLERLLKDAQAVDKLRRFAAIFVGGAACPEATLIRARELSLPLAPCYGATETAAMVTALDPADFLAGKKGVGQPLPGNTVECLPDRRIRVTSEAVFEGYLGEPQTQGTFTLPDEGKWDAEGNLHILQRADRVIISGGELVQPTVVETMVMKILPGTRATCMGAKDPDWGERVELVIECTEGERPDANELLQELKNHLPPSAIPKAIYFRSPSAKA